jgi:hypothetical protein
MHVMAHIQQTCSRAFCGERSCNTHESTGCIGSNDYAACIDYAYCKWFAVIPASDIGKGFSR